MAKKFKDLNKVKKPLTDGQVNKLFKEVVRREIKQLKKDMYHK